ncbi:MAG: hypothetical protein KJ614_03885 [Gammaproteobacteria bacterium]|uniref:hypothetical protein n=1 Tax=Rhodoferax sp. TaxID=50421 RepID=UPI00183AF98E|nr:hypothetical protein [Rhodoferax sp.]MBU3898059.1 hypothetical protein [Gammaproteobacteria bacterium]MBA3058558.1 hypothetical protein [Rhodoferax sp.]MBU3999184.1 hypothetical protein [Gammaproteobacteria bacterium]MBU4081747.1 hypothetical protein [Gammaproteobacteria bacterium]MBU4112760.1 hypothetical protein [Gammaproteobacteria bacterium]
MTTLYSSWRTLGRGGGGNGGATAKSGARPATCGPGTRCCFAGGGAGGVAQAVKIPMQLLSNRRLVKQGRLGSL